MNANISRRGFLTRLGVGALVVGGAAAMAACGKSGGDTQCKDPTGASDPLRKQNEYVDKSEKADQTCALCALFVAGEGGCGKCTLFQSSPVAPAGWCKAFAKKAA